MITVLARWTETFDEVASLKMEARLELPNAKADLTRDELEAILEFVLNTPEGQRISVREVEG